MASSDPGSTRTGDESKKLLRSLRLRIHAWIEGSEIPALAILDCGGSIRVMYASYRIAAAIFSTRRSSCLHLCIFFCRRESARNGLFPGGQAVGILYS